MDLLKKLGIKNPFKNEQPPKEQVEDLLSRADQLYPLCSVCGRPYEEAGGEIS